MTINPDIITILKGLPCRLTVQVSLPTRDLKDPQRDNEGVVQQKAMAFMAHKCMDKTSWVTEWQDAFQTTFRAELWALKHDEMLDVLNRVYEAGVRRGIDMRQTMENI